MGEDQGQDTGPVECSIFIAAPIEKVWGVASKMDGYPRFMEDVEAIEIQERDGNTTKTFWTTNVEGTPIIWFEIDTFFPEQFRIEYTLNPDEQNDLDRFDGFWQLKSVEGGTEVTLSTDFDFGIPNLTELIGPTLRVKVRENSEMMLKGMKRELEQPAVTAEAPVSNEDSSHAA